MPRYTQRALKDLAGLPESIRLKVIAVIERLDGSPNLGWKLKGKLEGQYSINVGRSHRIIYEVGKKADGVIVKTIGPRRDIYR